MPKLSKAHVKAVQATEDREAPDYTIPLPVGVYTAKLLDVEQKEGAKGPYWNWKYQLTEERGQGRFFWDITSLADNALWKIKQVFAAHGYEEDSSTSEMLGNLVQLSLTIKIRTDEGYEGTKENRIVKILPHSADDPTDGLGFGDDE